MSFIQLLDNRPDGIVLSASQIERKDRCERRWAIEYIGGVQPPTHPSARLGTQVHAVLELWLTKAVPPDVRTKQGRIAARMIAHLPLPGTGTAERRFYFVTRNGVAYTGFIDWSGVFFEWPTVIDHKTTGNLEYAKTAEQLHTDVQALTYTLAGCNGFGVDELQLMWGYACTKGKVAETKPVRTKIRLPTVEAQFDQILDPYGQELVWHRENPKHPMSYTPNLRACDDYGGCPHQHLCQFSEAERIEYDMNMPAQTTLADRLGGFTPPGAQPPQYVQPGYPPAGYQVPPGVAPQGGYQVPAPGPQGGFAPPQQGFVPPQAPGFTPPGQQGFAPPGQQPPQQPQQAFQPPPQGGYAQQPPQLPPGGPNAPESGQGAGLVAGEGGKSKRGRGRPKKDDGPTAEAMRQASAGPIPLGGAEERVVFMHGMTAMMRSPNWNGQPDQLQWAGQVAVQVYRAQYPAG